MKKGIEGLRRALCEESAFSFTHKNKKHVSESVHFSQKMFESDNVDLSRYSKQAFVDYMVDHDNYSWSTAEVIFEHIKDTGGSFILSDILKTYSEFDSYESAVKAEYDVLETEEGNIVVIGDY